MSHITYPPNKLTANIIGLKSSMIDMLLILRMVEHIDNNKWMISLKYYRRLSVNKYVFTYRYQAVDFKTVQLYDTLENFLKSITCECQVFLFSNCNII